jgi:hypothetical protein
LDKEKEISKLMILIESKLKRYSELTNEEMDELGKITIRLLKLNQQRNDEVAANANLALEKISEYESAIGIMEVFLLENDLYEQFLVFSDELIQDFVKNKKPNLTLVR